MRILILVLCFALCSKESFAGNVLTNRRKQCGPTTEEPPPKFENTECYHNSEWITAEECHKRCSKFLTAHGYPDPDSGVCHKGYCQCRWWSYLQIVDENVIVRNYLDKLEKYEEKRAEREKKRLAKKEQKRERSGRISADAIASCSHWQPEPLEYEPDDPDQPSCSSWQPRDREASE